MTHPREIGDWVAKTRGRWALLVVLAIDDHVHRFACAPDFERPVGLPQHSTMDQHGNEQNVVVVRAREAEHLQKCLPQYIRNGQAIFYTGKWEFIPLEWAHKDRDDVSRLPSVHDTKLPLRPGETFAQPLQNGYPVWYFLTGQISRPDKMKALWRLHQLPYRRRATVEGLKSIQYAREHCHCESLVRCSANDECRRAEGTAYLVKDKLSEDRLRYFHANIFRVIPCKITLRPLTPYAKAQEVDGLTFVFNWGPEAEAEICELAKETIPDALGTKRSIVLEGYTAALEAEGCSPRRNWYIWPILRDVGHPATDDADRRRKKFHPDYRLRSPLVPRHLQNPSHDDSESKKKAKTETTEEEKTVVSWKDEPLGITLTSTFTRSESNLHDEAISIEHIEDVATTSETEKPRNKKRTKACWNKSSESTTAETGTATTTGTVTATVTEVKDEAISVEGVQDGATASGAGVLEEAASTPVPESDEEADDEDSM
jgi:hypothetical protein